MRYTLPPLVSASFDAYQKEVIAILTSALEISKHRATFIADAGLEITDSCFWQSLSPSTACILIIAGIDDTDFPNYGVWF